MTDEERAEEITCKKFNITKNVLKNIIDGLIGKTYYERDIFYFYNGILNGLAEGRKETTYMKAEEFDKSLDKCRECDLIAEQKKQIDQLSVDNHVLKTAFIEQQGVINNLKEEIADPKVAMETIKKYCVEISKKYGNCSKCVFCSKGYNGCKLQTSPDNWDF